MGLPTPDYFTSMEAFETFFSFFGKVIISERGSEKCLKKQSLWNLKTKNPLKSNSRGL